MLLARAQQDLMRLLMQIKKENIFVPIAVQVAEIESESSRVKPRYESWLQFETSIAIAHQEINSFIALAESNVEMCVVIEITHIGWLPCPLVSE